VIGAAVARFEREATFGRLEVVEHGFGVDREMPAAASDQRVPGAEVALDRKGHLRRPAQARVEAHPKPLEQPDLPGVADRISGRPGPEREIEADHRAVRAKELEVRKGDFTSLESPDPSVRCIDGPTDVRLTQSGANACSPSVVRKPMDGRPAFSAAAIGRPLSRGHRHESCPQQLHCALAPNLGTASVQTDGRHARGRREAGPRPRVGSPSVPHGDREPILAATSTSEALVGTLGVHEKADLGGVSSQGTAR
jgi:hypothetical protein